MKRIEKEKIETTTIIFVAFDGTEFKTARDCLDYEFFMENKDKILSNILFFKCDYENNNEFKQISINELNSFDYCYLINDEYINYHKFFEYISKYYKDFKDIQKIGFYARDYSNMYNGGYGWNGWHYWGTIKELTLRNNFKKALDKVLKV